MRARLTVNPSLGEIDAAGQKAISSNGKQKTKKKKKKKKKERNEKANGKKKREKRLPGKIGPPRTPSDDLVERNGSRGTRSRVTVFQRDNHENRGCHAAWKTARVHENSQAVTPSNLAKALGG